jgi:hypothetical protein
MKKTKVLTLIFLVATISICWTTSHHSGTLSTCDSPIVGDHSGAPGEPTCSGCHPGTDNSGSGFLEFHVGNDSTYVPGQTYTCSVRMRQGVLSKFGFVNSALKNSNNTSTGTYTLTDVARTRKYTLGGRDYVSHTPCGADADTLGKSSWHYSWTAPANSVGNITFYISGLAANHDEATTGDFTYTRTVVLKPMLSASIEEIPGSICNVQIFPNPVVESFNLSYLNLSDEKTEIKLLDLQGRIIKILESGYHAKGIIKETFNVKEASIKPGTYLLSISKGTKQITQRILIQ